MKVARLPKGFYALSVIKGPHTLRVHLIKWQFHFEFRTNVRRRRALEKAKRFGELYGIGKDGKADALKYAGPMCKFDFSEVEARVLANIRKGMEKGFDRRFAKGKAFCDTYNTRQEGKK